MAERVPAPIVLPLSNPTDQIGGAPGGRARLERRPGGGGDRQPVRSGSRWHRHTRLIGQANNVFIFPGLGLGAIVARARVITDAMFLVAATTLAGMTSSERLARGALYPCLADLRPISRAIAVAVAREAHESGVAASPDDDIESAVDAAMWLPDYARLAH